MAIVTKDISPEESIKLQLQGAVREAGTPFADSSRDAVRRFSPYLQVKEVVDLGCGDGAATLFFEGVEVTGVDINPGKLADNPTKTVEEDMVSYLKRQPNNSIPNIFTHHALEHLPNPQVAINLIGNKLAKGGYLYAEVPAFDDIHVNAGHHSSFDDPADLLPEGFEVLEADTVGGTEHYIIARKP